MRSSSGVNSHPLRRPAWASSGLLKSAPTSLPDWMGLRRILSSRLRHAYRDAAAHSMKSMPCWSRAHTPYRRYAFTSWSRRASRRHNHSKPSHRSYVTDSRWIQVTVSADGGSSSHTGTVCVRLAASHPHGGGTPYVTSNTPDLTLPRVPYTGRWLQGSGTAFQDRAVAGA